MRVLSVVYLYKTGERWPVCFSVSLEVALFSRCYANFREMLTLELSSHVLELPNDVLLLADWLILGNNEKATLNVNIIIMLTFLSSLAEFRDVPEYWE